MIKIKFLKNYGFSKPGDVICISESIARLLIKRGIAKKVIDKKAKVSNGLAGNHRTNNRTSNAR